MYILDCIKTLKAFEAFLMKNIPYASSNELDQMQFKFAKSQTGRIRLRICIDRPCGCGSGIGKMLQIIQIHTNSYSYFIVNCCVCRVALIFGFVTMMSGVIGVPLGMFLSTKLKVGGHHLPSH
jgi:hypothetical protein